MRRIKEAVPVSRQAKERKVCSMPKNIQFQPHSAEAEVNGIMSPAGRISGPSLQTSENMSDQSIVMTVEEYETIRLIDYMNFTQEECAHHMQVARTTVQRIYNQARKKLSIFLVDGLKLYISGGSYELCDKHAVCRGSGFCEKSE